jgi:glutathione S-transferase
MSKPRIVYFDIRGRIEALRLMFEDLGVEYQDYRVSGAEWEEHRRTLPLPFGQLPLYEEGSLRLVQSRAIRRHVARVHGLSGRSEAEAALCDMVDEAIEEVRELFWHFIWRRDGVSRRAAFLDEEFAPRVMQLESWLAERGSQEHWLGEQPTYADHLGYHFTDELGMFFPELFETCPHLEVFHAHFAKRPRIAAYLASGRQPPAFGYGPEGLVFAPQWWKSHRPRQL